MEEVGVKLIIEGEAAFFATLEKVNKAINDLGGNAPAGLTSFEKALDKATKAAADSNPALNQTSKALNDTGQAAQNASGLYQDAAGRWRNSSGQFASDAEKAAAGVDKIPEAARRIPDGLKSAESGFNAFEEIVTGAMRRVGELIVNVGLQGAQAIAGFAQDSISAAGDFEAGLNEFAAAAGGSLDAAGLSVEDFSALFIQMGKDLPVSTADVEKAAIALVKGGLDPAIIAAGGLESSLNFAAGAGMELEAAAELGVKMMGTFTLVTDDAATKTAFLASAQDLLVKAANASTLNVEQLGDAMLAAGGQANAAGLEYEDFVTAMGLISPAFGSAAEAGTSFKNFLIRLNPTTAPAREAMSDLGLLSFNTADAMNYLSEQGIKPLGTDANTLASQIYELAIAEGATEKKALDLAKSFETSAFYDAAGNFVGVEQAAQTLQDSLAGLTDQQRVMALQAIFGNDAMGAANALANGGAEAYRAFAEQMANANGVQAQAAAVQQGLNFQMDNFMGSVEALQITIGMALMPVLEDLFANVLTPALGVIIEFTSALTGNQEAFAALSPPLQEIITTIQSLVQYVGEAASVFGTDGIGAALSTFGAGVRELNPALGGLIQAAAPVVDFLANNWQSAVAVAGGVLTAVLAPGIAAGAVAFGGVLVAAAPVIAILAAVGAAAAMLKGSWDQNIGGVQEKTALVMNTVRAVIENVMGIVLAFWEKNGADIMAFAQETWNSVQEIIGGIIAIVATSIAFTFGKIQVFLNEHGDKIQAVMQFAWDTISNLISNALDIIQGIVTTVLGLITGDWEKAGDGIMEIVGGLWDFISTQFQNILDLIEGLAPGFLAAATDVGSKVVDGIINGISNGLESIKSAAQDMAQAAMQAAKDALGIQSPSRLFAEEVGEPISQGIALGILNETQAVTAALDNLSKEAVKSLADLAEKAGNAMSDALSGKLGMVRGRLGLDEYMDSLYGRQEKYLAQIKDVEAANAEIDAQIADLRANGGDAEKIADLQGKRDANAGSLTTLWQQYTDLTDMSNRSYQALKEAQEQANIIAKTDAKAANEYMSLRRNQIEEIARYEEKITNASSDFARQRAKDNLETVKQAQALELEQFRNSAAARAKELGSMGESEATGNAVVDGIIQGIQARSAELANALGAAMSSALDAARKNLGIHSPSLVFAQQVGMPIAEGIGLGIEQAMGAPMAAINSLTSSLVRPAGPAVAGRGGGNTSIQQNWTYSPSYNSAPPNPSQDFAAMRVLATAR